MTLDDLNFVKQCFLESVPGSLELEPVQLDMLATIVILYARGLPETHVSPRDILKALVELLGRGEIRIVCDESNETFTFEVVP